MKWLIVGLLVVVFGLVGWIIGNGAQAGERKPERRPGVACMFDPACNTPERRDMFGQTYEERQLEQRIRGLENGLRHMQEEERMRKLGGPRY